MRLLQVKETNSGAVVANHLRPAHTHWTRLRGLLGTKSLDDGHGLWIKPCNQVHMFFMKYAIDLVFLDDNHRVVRLIEGLAPGKISPKVSDARSVLELPVGTIARAGLAEGASLAIDDTAH